ncbi:Rid family hydrolase [Cellvibrio sp. UBA7661]|uniref:Rid family hydrolase n=1 Tax=Cellvibrio sp. UBA7661 TaxID=1946311 RepID=UPI002F353424
MSEMKIKSPGWSRNLLEGLPYLSIRRSENLLFVAGIVGHYPNGAQEPDFERQVELAYENLREQLAAEKCTFKDVIDITVFVTDALRQMMIAMKIQQKLFGQRVVPNWSSYSVSCIEGLGFDFEIKAIARIPE